MRIFIDPGHGGKDNGAAYGYDKEDEINLIISQYLEIYLNLQGYKTEMSRTLDEYILLEDRCHMANEWGADLFISIHCDAWHKIIAHGMSVHIYEHTTISEPLGRAIDDSLAERFPGHKQRGVKRSNFHVLRKTNMPAALVECEFLSNPKTREFLRQSKNQLALAQAIGAGIEEYLEGV